MNDTNEYVWGYHCSVDAAGCDKTKITDGDYIARFATALVEAIDMKAYGEPQVVHFAEHDPGKAGFTLTQLIETSNISAHFVDATGEIYLDVFSCKDFDPETVAELVNEWFKPTSGEIFFRERGVQPVGNALN